MAPRRRDYQAEYASRKAKATAEGWRSYGQKRTGHKSFQEEPPSYPGMQLGEGNWLDLSAEEVAAAYYRAFRDPKERHKKGADSPKAKWFVDVVGKVPSYAEWEARYAA